MASKFLVKSLWIGSAIGDLQKLCFNSFITGGVEFHLYTYQKIANIPDGIIIKDANKILDEKLIFKDSKDTYATFSDWFRMELLYKLGGWWVDCDILFVKKFNFKARYVFVTERVNVEISRQIRICNAVIKMPKKSKLGKKILLRIEKKIKERSLKDIAWTEIGSLFLAEEILNSSLQKYIVVPEVFCPNPYYKFCDLAVNTTLKFDDRTHAVHLWNSMWKWNGLNPLDVIVTDSVLDNARKGTKLLD